MGQEMSCHGSGHVISLVVYFELQSLLGFKMMQMMISIQACFRPSDIYSIYRSEWRDPMQGHAYGERNSHSAESFSLDTEDIRASNIEVVVRRSPRTSDMTSKAAAHDPSFSSWGADREKVSVVGHGRFIKKVDSMLVRAKIRCSRIPFQKNDL